MDRILQFSVQMLDLYPQTVYRLSELVIAVLKRGSPEMIHQFFIDYSHEVRIFPIILPAVDKFVAIHHSFAYNYSQLINFDLVSQLFFYESESDKTASIESENNFCSLQPLLRNSILSIQSSSSPLFN